MSNLSPWRVRWTNFRGYEKSPTVELPGLTVLIGRNNVGKTSTYVPLLLLRQTLDSRDRRTALLFRGDLVDLGSYKDAVTDHDLDRKIVMSLDFGPSEISFGVPDSGRPKPRGLELTFAASDSHPADLQKSSMFADDGKVIVSRTKQGDGSFKVVSTLLPTSVEIGRPIKEVTQLRKSMQIEKPNHFFFSGVAGLSLPSKWRQDHDRWNKVQGWYRACSDIYELSTEINYKIEDELRAIAYLGPLRSAPQRSYLLSAEPPTDVGRDGQWAPEVLLRSWQEAESDVLDRVNEWLTRLEYGRLGFATFGEYFQVAVKKPKSKVEVNLADCGAGLSQLLPLLVQGCVMNDGDTLIAQQPEIHLNPAQQDVVTDFMIDLVTSGKRVIIETHSEHVLGRLRRRIAEGDTIANSDVALYFSEGEMDRSTLRRIPVGGWGEIDADEWPKGFFGEQLQNSLKMAIAQSRRKRTEQA